MTEKTSRRGFGIGLLCSIAFVKPSVASSDDRSAVQKELQNVYAEYNVSNSRIRFARRELPHFLEGTELAAPDERILAAPDRTYIPENANYDTFLSSDDEERIVERAAQRYQRKYGVDPRDPAMTRIGDLFVPDEFLEDLYEEVVHSQQSVPSTIDIETLTGNSTDELRRQYQEHAADAGMCECCNSNTIGIQSRRPPGVSSTTPTAEDSELILHRYLPPFGHDQYPSEGTLSDTQEAFGRFEDDELDNLNSSVNTTVTTHYGDYDPPETDSSSTQLDEFADYAHDAEMQIRKTRSQRCGSKR
ncbi:hypothetical protein [Natronobacterium texcoconense]|uniref:Uncharacterized protein n=1 Tax=Natronobacterium texcoconense TaxID=1095778 RepID=A0A1H1IFE8_NATTX|nr:hypothetical protein [Natronobacterium texcoconense]SDR36457.1 hypothetical protein SAMN04489842_3525 [Natronobacterium texcoconense]